MRKQSDENKTAQIKVSAVWDQLTNGGGVGLCLFGQLRMNGGLIGQFLYTFCDLKSLTDLYMYARWCLVRGRLLLLLDFNAVQLY